MAATVAATSLLAIRVKKCKHISEKNAILCLENRRTLLDIFIDLHGDLPKDSRLSIVCNNSTDPSKGTSFDVYPNMLVGDLVGTFAIKRIEYSCSTEEQTVALGEIINNAAEAATSKTVDAFQVLMAGGRKNVSLKTSSCGVKDGISRKDEIYNKLVENFFNSRNLDFPRASCEQDGSYFVQVLCNALCSVSWNQGAEDIKQLAECFTAYKEYLVVQNKTAQENQSKLYPVRTIDKEATIEHRYGNLSGQIREKYVDINEAVTSAGIMAPVVFDEYKHLDKPFEKEFDIVLSPEQKRQRFLCSACSWAVVSMAKSSAAKREAMVRIKEHGELTYLAKKIRSPEQDMVTSQALPKKRKQLSMPEREVHKALNCIRQRKYTRGLSLLIKARTGFKKSVIAFAQRAVRMEMICLCRNQTSPFKGGKTVEEIGEFDWEKQFTELSKQCPILSSVLIGALTTEKSVHHFGLASKPCMSAKPVIGTLGSILAFQRKPKSMNYFQELNSVQMWLAGCQREMFNRLNHLGLCVGIKGTRSYLDRIRSSYDTEVFKWKTEICDYLLGLRSDSSVSGAYTIPYADSEATLSVDSFPSSAASSPQRPPARREYFQPQMQQPNEDLDVNLTKSTSEESMSLSDRSLPKGRCGFSLCFDNVNQRTTVRHQTRDAKNKMFNMVQGYAARDRVPTLHLSDDVPLPERIKAIPLENYLPSEMDEVDLRFELTTIVHRILCEYIPILKPLASAINWHIQHRYSDVSAAKSQLVPIGVLDKDESRVSDTIDILEEYHKYVPLKPNGQPFKLLLHADGLSVERGNNAQNARINGNTAWKQLKGLQMNIQEWHKRCLLLQDIFDEMYKGSSGREIGTLF
uniref:DUF6589 domain-containing protein n=1 Tax=Magallana gigas TaxID=29159 RepID=A0A8W8JTD6_MAGGI